MAQALLRKIYNMFADSLESAKKTDDPHPDNPQLEQITSDTAERLLAAEAAWLDATIEFLEKVKQRERRDISYKRDFFYQTISIIVSNQPQKQPDMFSEDVSPGATAPAVDNEIIDDQDEDGEGEEAVWISPYHPVYYVLTNKLMISPVFTMGDAPIVLYWARGIADAIDVIIEQLHAERGIVVTTEYTITTNGKSH